MAYKSKSTDTKRATNTSATAQPVVRKAANKLDMPQRIAVDLPLIGAVLLPAPQQLAYYCAIGALVALEIIDWPIALLITTGHALTQQQHNQTLEDLGEVLEHL